MFTTPFQPTGEHTQFRARNIVRGMSLVEVVIASAVIVLVFGGLLAGFQLVVSLIGVTKAETGALALANERIEYLRSLPYDSVGTVGGIPSGLVPQNTTRVLNGVTYNERVLIEYVDDPADGEGGDDVNGILADYKRAKIEYTWDQKGDERTRTLISNIVPRGIETTDGGGTLTVNVFDANVMPVEGALVHLYNGSGTTTIDTVRYTNDAGIAMFSGAPALANYEITVTKDGYSTDGTAASSPSNANPATPHVAVIESEVSTMNFQIDTLASVEVTTVGIPVTESHDDTFLDASGISFINNASVGGGNVTLSGTPGTYPTSGEVRSQVIAPSVFASWDALSFDVATSSDAETRIHIYTVVGTSTYELISDSTLPGNSAGFTGGSVDLSSLDVGTYPALALGATLVSSDPLITPALRAWELFYTIEEPPISNVPFTLTSNKIIGTTGAATPVPKFVESFDTDGAGVVTISDLEWGVYAVTLDTLSYDIAEACPMLPLTLAPGAAASLKLTLAASAAYSLRVEVVDVTGAPILGADVELSRSGFTDTFATSVCGQTFFNDALTSATDYTLTVSKAGYTTEIRTDLTVAGDEFLRVVLVEG